MKEQNRRVEDQNRQRDVGDPNGENQGNVRRRPEQRPPRQGHQDEQRDRPEADKDLSQPQHDLTEDESEEKTP